MRTVIRTVMIMTKNQVSLQLFTVFLLFLKKNKIDFICYLLSVISGDIRKGRLI